MVTIMKGDVLPIRPWEQAARLLDYGFGLGPNDTVGDLVEPQTTSAVTSTRTSEATPSLARPPTTASGSSSRQSEMQAQGDTVVRIGVGVIGAIVVIGLLWGARRLSRNR